MIAAVPVLMERSSKESQMTQDEIITHIKSAATNHNFAAAADAAVGHLKSLNADSAARQFVRSVLNSREFSLVGSNVRIAAGTDAFFRPFAQVVMARFGDTADESIVAAERSALSYAYQHRFGEAAAALEPIFAAVKRRFGESHATTQRLRYNLECQYRNGGRADLADALVP